MAIKCLLKIHPQVINNDLPILPKALQLDFEESFKPILRSAPHNCGGILPFHLLKGKLKGYQAMEVAFEGDKNLYRLVYRIHHKPSPSHVYIVSFAQHDLAYEYAKIRRRRK